MKSKKDLAFKHKYEEVNISVKFTKKNGIEIERVIFKEPSEVKK